ncbi:nuclease [Priestia megaterium]|nr:nuclease [Priestia megaterium]
MLRQFKFKIVLLIFVLACAYLLTGCSILNDSEKEKNSEFPRFDAKVVKVSDGDTVTISFNGKEERVRMLLVDSPESVHPSKPVQPYGVEASDFTKKSLTGKDVEVELGNPERDKYGRLLAYLYVDGKMYNETLLEKGLARVAYVYAPNTRYVDEFRAIQDKARKKEIGIWSIENYAENDFETPSTQDSSPSNKMSNVASSENSKNASKTTKSGTCNIKGNITSKGEKIYHVPGGQYYEGTKEEELFCSSAEAEAAGYRASVR